MISSITNLASRRYALIGLIVLTVALVLFLSRQIFYFKYDAEYYEDRYYHSQWNIPDSIRSISDGELYKFVGYRLVEGENPFNINYEVPPFAKYLYGASSYVFGNPYLLSISLYLGSIMLVYLLSKELFAKNRDVLLGTLLYTATPFIATQVKETMLDLPLTFFYLLHALFFIRYLKNKRMIDLLVAGFGLGLASGVKLGVYTPLAVLFAESALVYLKKYKSAVIYPFVVVGGYLGSYFMYFIKHPNPIPWLRLHEKTIDFYTNGDISTSFFNQWRLIFLNQYEGWWNPGQITNINDWSLLLPVGTIAFAVTLYKAIKKRDVVWFYISGLVASVLIVNTIIPIYPRYLMPAIPFFAVLVVKFFKKLPIVILLMALLGIPTIYRVLYSHDPQGDISTTAHFMNIRAYKELYKMSYPESLDQVSMDKFIDLNEKFFDGISTRKIEVIPGNYNIDNDVLTVNYNIVYHTQYGTVSHNPDFEFKRFQNKWQLMWDWDYLWNGYGDGVELVVNEGQIPLEKVIDQNGKTQAIRGNWKAVYIIPRVMNPWNEFLDNLKTITLESRSEINSRIRSVVPDHFPRFVGYLDPRLSLEKGDETVRKIPGATLRDVSFLVPLATANTDLLTPFIEKLLVDKPNLFVQKAQVYLMSPDGTKHPIEFANSGDEDEVIQVY